MDMCEKFEDCGFLKKYRDSYKKTCATLIEEYCNNREKSETCARKKIFKETGTPPEDDLMPNGDFVDL